MMDALNTAVQTLDFDPDRPIDWTPEWERDVTVWPWGGNEPGGFRRAAGVFDAKGNHLPASHCWRYADSPMTVVPDRDDTAPQRHFEGRWLFGGVYYPHFGHFLVETTSRLWALEKTGPVAGILFFPKKKLTHEFKLIRDYVPFFAALGLGELTLRAPQVPVTVDALALPEPGFGIGEMIAGRPEYRAFMRDRLSHIAPEGARDIYVSRTGLASRRGTVVMESRIEDLLSAAGYEIFHPQCHSITEQIARYRAARRIVALDGSGLHLAAMVVEPGTQVAIINRGPSMNINDYVLQFRYFAGIDPVTIEAIKGCWSPEGHRFVRREAKAHMDFPTLGAALSTAGFIPDTKGWVDPPMDQIDARLVQLSDTFKAPMIYRDLAS